MRDVNGWLMALAFLLGLVLTLGLTVRRVTREVPVTHTVAAGAAGATRAKLTGAAGAVGGLAGAVGDKIEGLLERDPHGAGSVRLAARKDAPAGYSVKFDPSAKRYLAPGDAGYEELETEWWFADEASAQAAGFVGAAAVVAVPVDEVEAGPFGKGSAKAGPGGSGPAGWLIKGNADSMLYHPPDSPAYQQTIAEVWFFDEETARAAGFDKWDKNFR